MRGVCIARRTDVVILLKRQFILIAQSERKTVSPGIPPYGHEIMRTVADHRHLFRKFFLYGDRHAPVRRFEMVVIQTFYAAEVFAPGQCGRPGAYGTRKDIVSWPAVDDFSLINDYNLLTETVDLVPAVRDHKDHSREIFQLHTQFPVHLIAKMDVQSRKWFIQKDNIRRDCQNPGQRHSLLLPAGKLGRIVVFQAFQTKTVKQGRNNLISVCLLPGNACRDILRGCHRRKEGIILEQVSDLPLLRLHVNPLFRIKEHMISHGNLSLIRAQDPCNHFQRHAFTSSGSAKDSDPLRIAADVDIQRKITGIVFDCCFYCHPISPSFPSIFHHPAASRQLPALRTPV